MEPLLMDQIGFGPIQSDNPPRRPGRFDVEVDPARNVPLLKLRAAPHAIGGTPGTIRKPRRRATAICSGPAKGSVNAVIKFQFSTSAISRVRKMRLNAS